MTLYLGGGGKDKKKRQDKGGSEARNGSKVPKMEFCSSSSALSKPDREIFRYFAAVATAVRRIAMT